MQQSKRDRVVVYWLALGPDSGKAAKSQHTLALSISGQRLVSVRCALFTHGTLPGEAIRTQPLSTKGGIGIADGVRLDAGVIVLDGVTIGTGAHVQPRSVVTHDVPEGYVVSGIPARPTE